MREECGWIALDRAARFRKDNPDGPIVDWRRFAVDNGMELVWRRMPNGEHAARVGKIIFIQYGLTERDEQAAIRHEVCHYLIHSCNMLWWQRQRDGELMISKYERQANELSWLLGSD